MKVIPMQYETRVDFGFHVENGEIIIDRCEGISPQDGLALFPRWALEGLLTEHEK